MALKDYVPAGVITMETALLYAANADDLKVQLDPDVQRKLATEG